MDGDSVAQSCVYEMLVPVAYKVAHQVLKNASDAEDVAHDAMMKVLQRLFMYDSRWSIRTWVSRIARNTAIDLLRKRRKVSWHGVPDYADARPLQDEVAMRNERQAMVRRALVDLPPMYREVIDLHHFQDLKYREIASELDVPIGTVMNRIFRARQKMKATLTKAAA